MSSVPSSFVPVEPSRRAARTIRKKAAARVSVHDTAAKFKAAVFAPHNGNPDRHAAMRAAAIALANYFRDERNSDKLDIIEKACKLAVWNGLPDDIINILFLLPRAN